MPQRRHTPELKLLHGVDPNELVDTTAKPPRREPERPKDLSVVERQLWDRVTADLRDMDLLSSADTDEIRAYVQCVVLGQRLYQTLAGAKNLVNANLDTGVVHPHPGIVAYERMVNRAHALASGLGLNPHGRSLIHGRTVARSNTEAAQVRDLYA